MKEITKHLKAVFVLILIQFLLDMLYVYIYPDVNPIRATMIGITALIILYLLSLTEFYSKIMELKPHIAFLPIYSSALFGALLVQADVVKSKSIESGVAHVAILIVMYSVIIMIKNKNRLLKNR